MRHKKEELSALCRVRDFLRRGIAVLGNFMIYLNRKSSLKGETYCG